VGSGGIGDEPLPEAGETSSDPRFEPRDQPAAKFSSKVVKETEDGTTVLVVNVRRQEITARATDQRT
jgi:hypothetical protein